MNNNSPIRPLFPWVTALAVAVILIWVVRYAWVSSYRISTVAMAEAMVPGDYILVNKWSSEDNPGRNRAVLFSSPLLRDSVYAPLLVARCLGMPGDTVEVNERGYAVNGNAIPFAPQSIHTYLLTERYRKECLNTMQTLQIPLREWTADSLGHTLRLTSFEAWQLREELNKTEDPLPLYDLSARYRLVVPRAGRAYRLDEITLTACKEAIRREAGEKARFHDNKLYLDGRETSFFFFEQDYYWVLADNARDGIDSRHLGFIPADHIVGNAWLCWYSRERERIFKRVR